jgi:hypothetical protein
MTTAAIVALITAVAGLVTAVTALIHSVQTRQGSVGLADSMARAATGIVRQAPTATPPSDE